MKKYDIPNKDVPREETDQRAQLQCAKEEECQPYAELLL